MYPRGARPGDGAAAGREASRAFPAGFLWGKWIKSADLLDVTINDGLHFHGIMLVNVDSRLKVRLDMHFREHYARYVRSGDILRRIHIQPVDDPTANRATGYALKSLEWRIPDTDRIFIRPRSLPLGAPTLALSGPSSTR